MAALDYRRKRNEKLTLTTGNHVAITFIITRSGNVKRIKLKRDLLEPTFGLFKKSLPKGAFRGNIFCRLIDYY